MKKIINLTESDLIRIVKRILSEDGNVEGAEMPETPPAGYDDLIAGVFNDDQEDSEEGITETDVTNIIKRMISESPLGSSMLKKLHNKLEEEYSDFDIRYDDGDYQFDPYIYITLEKEGKTSKGLLIDLDDDDHFELHFDDGRFDRPWSGWKKEIDRLNSVKNGFMAVKMFMDKHTK